MVVEAAAQVLLDQGYGRASTNRIAERAGVSVGSLYQYFAGKEAIYELVLERYLESLVAAVRDIEMDSPTEVLFEAIVSRVLAVREDGPELLRRLQASGVANFQGRLADAKRELARHFCVLLQARGVSVAAETLERRLGIALDAAEGMLVHSAPKLPPAVFAAEIARMMAPYITAPEN
ncbi:MAG: TetR/AcrR family transcriptional regulator [Gammaproteobacteria bacterium]